MALAENSNVKHGGRGGIKNMGNTCTLSAVMQNLFILSTATGLEIETYLGKTQDLLRLAMLPDPDVRWALGYIVQSRLLQSSPNNSKFQKGKQHDAAEVIQALLELTDANGNEFQDLQKLIAFNRKQRIEGCTCKPKHAEISFINKDMLFLPVCSCHQSKDCKCEFKMKEMCKAAINVEEQVTYDCAPEGKTVKKVDLGPEGHELPMVVITSQKRYTKDCCCTSQERIKCAHQVVCGCLLFAGILMSQTHNNRS